MMEIRQPQWRLRRVCPVCVQGGLVLVACPECSHIAVICAEKAFRAATSDEILVLVSARSTTSNQAAIPTNSTLSVSPSFA